MAFAAVTILMDTLHQHFLQPTPRFPLRNKGKVKSLYRNLSCLQTCLEELDFKVGEDDKEMKGLEAQVRDVSVELRFQIEEQLRLFYLGKAMRLRLRSAQKLLPILKGAIKDDIETQDLDCMYEILQKHLMLPVSRMPAHIKKRVKSFWRQDPDFLCRKGNAHYEQDSNNEEEDDGDEQDSNNEQEREDEQESNGEQESADEWESEYEQEKEDEQESEDEWETEEEQKSDDEQERSVEQRTQYMLHEAESLIRLEIRASYLKTYMKQRIQATQNIRHIFMLGIKLTIHKLKDEQYSFS